MLNKFYTSYFALFIAMFSIQKSAAQCTWQNVVTDGFEYQTVCPDIIPGTTYQNIPQSYAVHGGSYSLYLNFANCASGTGTCAGDTAYIRHFTVCRNMSVRFSTWFTTSFSGTQSNVKIVIKDGNGTVLNLQPSILAPYAPNWIQYNSGVITPVTDDIYFILITNVDGGGGNDLSMDDFTMDQCFPTSTGTSVTGNICNNLIQQNLFGFLSASSDTTGTWSGPGTLTGGYLGTFTLATSPTGQYVYNSNFYGTGVGCPPTADTVVTSIVTATVPHLGNDTIICSTQSLFISPGNLGAVTYNWNNGTTAPYLMASTTIIAGDTNIYWVQVTNANGCHAIDSIQVIFVNCTGVNDLASQQVLNMYPNPVSSFFTVDVNGKKNIRIEIMDETGKKVKEFSNTLQKRFFVGDLPKAGYFVRVICGDGMYMGRMVKQ